MIDLEGAVDVHVHSAPDVYPRSLDDLELARAAEEAGMGGLLLKSHHTLTADRAELVGKQVGIPIRGGLALNLTVGGINPVAVETAIAFGARQIWMPTIHARNCMATATGEMFQREARKGYAGLVAFDESGQPAANLLAVLELVRDADVVLGTGHLAPQESLRLIELARGMGQRRILVTHPLMSFTRFTTDQMRTAVAWGATLEFDALSCHPNWPRAMSPTDAAAAIAAVGPAHCVIGSDGGQAANGAAPRMLLAFAQALEAAGTAEADLRRMLRDNPAELLGL